MGVLGPDSSGDAHIMGVDGEESGGAAAVSLAGSDKQEGLRRQDMVFAELRELTQLVFALGKKVPLLYLHQTDAVDYEACYYYISV